MYVFLLIAYPKLQQKKGALQMNVLWKLVFDKLRNKFIQVRSDRQQRFQNIRRIFEALQPTITCFTLILVGYTIFCRSSGQTLCVVLNINVLHDDICEKILRQQRQTSAYPTSCAIIYDSKCTEAALTSLKLFKEFKVVSFCNL